MTYAELRTYVRDRLTISTGDTAKTTQINTAIQQARYRLSAEFRLTKTKATLNFTADTETVTLPSDVVEILSITSGNYIVQPISEQEWAEVAGSVVAGGPQVYVVDGSSTTIRISPVPADTETAAATIYYVARPTALSADADVPTELPAEFHDLIAEMAVYRIAQSEEDFDLARGAAVVADELRGELRAYMIRRRGPTASRQALRGFAR